MSRAALPDKLYFRIGEAAKLVGVKPYVLRYWESEFSILRPGKTRARHRLYRRKDVETLLEIKRLLHTERYTIEGAKRRLRGDRLPDAEPTGSEPIDLAEIRSELQALCRLLEDEPAPTPIPLTIGTPAKHGSRRS